MAVTRDELIQQYNQHHSSGNLEEAFASLLDVHNLSPEDSWVNRELGMIAYWLDRHEEARHFLLEASRLEPAMTFVNQTLGHVMMMKGDARSAAEHYSSEIDLNAGLGAAHFLKGLCLQEIGDMENARLSLHLSLQDPALWSEVKVNRSSDISRRYAPHKPWIDVDAMAQQTSLMCSVGPVLIVGNYAATVGPLLLRRAVDVYGIGDELDNVREANAIAGSRFLPGLATRLPYTDAMFPNVICLFGLNGYSLTDVKRAIQEIARVCSSRAVFICYQETIDGELRDAAWWRNCILDGPFQFVPFGSSPGAGVPENGQAFTFTVELRPSGLTEAREGYITEKGTIDEPIIGNGPKSDELFYRYNGISRFARDQIRTNKKITYACHDRGAVGGAALFTRLTNRNVGLLCATDDIEHTANSLFTPFFNKLTVIKSTEAFESEGYIIPGCLSSDIEGTIDPILKTIPIGINSFVVLEVGCETNNYVDAKSALRDIIDRINTSIDGRFSLRRVGLQIRAAAKINVFGCDVKSEADCFAALDHAFGMARNIFGFVFLITPKAMVEKLAALSWPEFRASYSGIDSRPLLSNMEKGELAALTENALFDLPAPDQDTFFKAVLARLASGYGAISSKHPSEQIVKREIECLERLDHFGAALPEDPEITRWLSSVRRLQAQLWLTMGQFEEAQERFTAVFNLDHDGIQPLLCRNMLDSYLYSGRLHLGAGDRANASETWRSGVDASRKLAQRFSEQILLEPYHYSESAYIFIDGQMLLQAMNQSVHNRESQFDLAFDIRIANSSIPMPVDRYGDRISVGLDSIRRYY